MDEVETEEQIESPVDGASVAEYADSPLEYTPEIESSRTSLIEEFSDIESAIGRYRFILEHYPIQNNYHVAKTFHEEISADVRDGNITPYVNRYPLQKFDNQKEVSKLLIKKITLLLNESNKDLTHIDRDDLQYFLDLVREVSLSDIERNAIIYDYLIVISDTQMSKTIEEDFERLKEKSLLEGVFDISVDEIEAQLPEESQRVSSSSGESIDADQRDIVFYSGISILLVTIMLGVVSLYFAFIGTMYMGFPVWEMLGIISMITATLGSVLIALGSD
jgi:hypothetical protein